MGEFGSIKIRFANREVVNIRAINDYDDVFLEIETNKEKSLRAKQNTGMLLKDFILQTLDYLPKMIEKYGDQNFREVEQQLNKES